MFNKGKQKHDVADKPAAPPGQGAGAQDGGDDQAAARGLVVRVVAKRDGYRRAGRAWTVAPTELPVEALSVEQLAGLQADPNLKVEVVEAAQ